MSAIGNHFLFRHFDQLSPQQAGITQGWLNAIAVALAFIFKACIVCSLLTAFNQLLWFTFRERSLKSIHIEALFSIPTDLYSLLNFDILRLAPLPWIVALMCWFIPLASVFPPGALSVNGVLQNSIEDVLVPTFNASANTSSLIGWGGSAEDCYTGAGQDLLRLTTLTILGGSVLSFPSPCGANCTYGISFLGPAFQCQNSTLDPDNPYYNFRSDGEWIETNIIDNVYWLWFLNVETDPPNLDPLNQMQAISCHIYEAIYNVTVRFSDSSLFFDDVNITYQNLWEEGVNASSLCIEPYQYQSTPPGPFWDSLNIGAISSSVSTLLNGNVTFSSIAPCRYLLKKQLGWAIALMWGQHYLE
jgi:hypothetical protein